MYVHIRIDYMYIITVNVKRGHNGKIGKKGMWESLDSRLWMKEWYNCILILKNK